MRLICRDPESETDAPHGLPFEKVMNPRIIGIGELLWDMLPTGARMGGAPANFTCHAKALGADAAIISRVGSDSLGAGLIAKLHSLGVSTEGISEDPVNATGTVLVQLGQDGQPHFEITRGVAWDHLVATPDMLRMVRSADAICFGSLGQRSASSRAAIRKLVAATSADALRVFDVNLREEFFTSEILDDSLALATVCKLSDAELPVIAEMLGLKGDVGSRLEELRRRYDLRLVVYTRGADGSLIHDGHEWCDQPGLPAKVRDTIGAGDSFTCAVVMGLLQGWSLEKVSRAANEIAAHVCSCDGAVPELPQSLRERFQWNGRSADSPALPAPVKGVKDSVRQGY
jgi:fructokinase